MAKVTVILTSYNHEKYLREAIESVLQQSFSDFELIIGDDASTDNSWEIIQSYNDPRIRLYRHEINRGGGIINELISSGAVNSDYIAIHHSDDVWEPEKLKKQTAILNEHRQIGAVFAWVQIIDEHGEPFQDQDHFYYKVFEQPNRTRYEWLNYFFYRGNALCHPSALIRKECYADVGLYRYGLSQIGDFDMWVRLCMKYEICVIPEKLVRFRVRSNEANTSGNRSDANIRTQFEYLQALYNYMNVNDPIEFQKIFPETAEYFKEDEHDIGFALAMAAIAFPFDFSHLLGLQLLFDLLNDPLRAEKVKRLYGFSMNDFSRLNLNLDVFSFLLKHRTFPQTQAQLAESKAQLAEIHASRGWRLVLTWRRIRLRLIPPGSRREVVARFLFGILRAIKHRLFQ